jgi:hypothetical protein
VRREKGKDKTREGKALNFECKVHVHGVVHIEAALRCERGERQRESGGKR